MDLEDLYDDNNKLKVPLRRSLAENKKVLGILFENCGDVVQKSFAMERARGHGVSACCIYRWFDE